MLNSFDAYALESALLLKSDYKGVVTTALSMGNLGAEEIIRDAIAMGIDEGFLLSDKRFAGADTLATSYTLAKGVSKIGGYDLIICGRQTTDGDTGQVGVQLAVRLGIPYITGVNYVEKISGNKVICRRCTDELDESVEVELPALIIVEKNINEPRLATLRGLIKSRNSHVAVLSLVDIDADIDFCGTKGSATKVLKTYVTRVEKKGEILSGANLDQQVNELLRKINIYWRNIQLNKNLFEHTDELLNQNDRQKAMDFTPNDNMKELWVWYECDHVDKTRKVVYELISKARELAYDAYMKVAVVIVGDHNRNDIAKIKHYGVDKIYIAETSNSEYVDISIHGEILAQLAEQYQPEIILVGATAKGKTVAATTAAKLKTGLTADCTGLEIEKNSKHLLQTRPAMGGDLMATIVCREKRPQIATVRPNQMEVREKGHTGKGELIYCTVKNESYLNKVRVLESILRVNRQVGMMDSEIIVAGGRGLKKKENFAYIEELASCMNGSIAVSRPIVDIGWKSHDYQVGQTGSIVRPRIYFAFGISGAVHHLMGMKDASVIVAVNTDANAPIFNYATFGIVGDAVSTLKLLLRTVKQ